MSPLGDIFQQRLARALNDEYEARAQFVLNGYSGTISNVVLHYKESVGFLAGIRRAIDLCEQVEREQSGS